MDKTRTKPTNWKRIASFKNAFKNATRLLAWRGKSTRQDASTFLLSCGRDSRLFESEQIHFGAVCVEGLMTVWRIPSGVRSKDVPRNEFIVSCIPALPYRNGRRLGRA